MRLVYTANPQARRASGEDLKKGDEVRVGDRVHTSRMEPCTVAFFREPHKPASVGHVSLKFEGRTSALEVYVSVISAEWIGRDE